MIRFETIPPAEKTLLPHIKCYYIHVATAPDFYQKITYYPNFTTTLNCYRYSKVDWTELSRTHTYSDQAAPLKLLVSKFDRAREIVMQGPMDKVSIVFHPLGLHHFVDAPMTKVIGEHFTFFEAWGAALDELLPTLFEVPTLVEKRDLLDAFLMERYRDFQTPRLRQAVDIILKSEETVRVTDLATALKISRKTLLRLFRKHLGYSVEEYLSVVRFRKALNLWEAQQDQFRLTDLAYESGYYDQPDFNHQFKLKTGMNPRQLFAVLESLDDGLFWNFSS